MSLPSIRAVWQFRGFILSSVKREFQARYQNSLLGALWTFINPLAMILVYTLVFSQLMKARLPGVDSGLAYGIYLCAGILTWGFFAEVIGKGQAIFLENARLLKKLSFPRICLPIVVLFNASVNFAIIWGLFISFLLLSGNFPGWVILGIVPVLVIQMLFALGLGICLGVVNVFFRDVGHLTGVILQFWFWFTPIVYPLSVLPDQLQALVRLNPMAQLIGAYQGVFIHQQWPAWQSLWPSALLALLLCAMALALFRKRAGEMVDEL
ncbi:ABC transporter permease [Pseudomonas alcaligenes]|uniref:ABC transporter permease n=1 Tax=Aquipseudomonas alcaligenes TaxID=43263 RepID=UPI00358F470B